MIKELFKTQKGVNSAEAQFKKMTETPINKLITSLSVPTVISMLITEYLQRHRYIFRFKDQHSSKRRNRCCVQSYGNPSGVRLYVRSRFRELHKPPSRRAGYRKGKEIFFHRFFSFADRRDCDHGARIDISDPSYDASGQHSNHFALCQRLRDLHTAFRSGYDCELRCKQYFEI